MNKLLMKSAGVALGSLSLMLFVNAADAGAAGKKVAYFDAGPSHPYVVALNKAFNARAKDRGLEVTQFDTPYDAALQAQQIDDAIARKFDLLAIMAASQSAIVPALNRAKKAGIPVVILNNGIKDGVEDLYVANVIDDNAKLGRLAADATLRALKEGGRDQAKVALITGVLAEGVAKTRLDAFIAALKDHPASQDRGNRGRLLGYSQERNDCRATIRALRAPGWSRCSNRLGRQSNSCNRPRRRGRPYPARDGEGQVDRPGHELQP